MRGDKATVTSEDHERLSLVDAAAIQVFPTPPEILVAVQRLIDAGLFAADSRTHHLLDYLIDHARRAGERAPVKAISIAIDVLGRDERFDPSVDSIVRVEIGRLRKLLDLYYSGAGARDPLRFAIPKGQTRLEVRRQAPPRAAAAHQTVTAGKRRVSPWAMAMSSLAVAAGIAVYFATAPSPAILTPRIVVAATEVVTSDARLEPLARGVSPKLLSDLSSFRTFRVVPWNRSGTPTLEPADYALTTHVSGTYPWMTIIAALIRGEDMSVAWSGRRTIDLSRDEAEDLAAILREIVQRICGPQGTCEADTLGRLAHLEQSSGQRLPAQFACILRFHGFDRSKDPAARDQAEACLYQLVRDDVRDAAVWSAHAFMLLLAWSEAETGVDDPTLVQALEAAAQAVALDPAGADGHEALGSVLTVQSRLPEARGALERAAVLNPSSGEIDVKLGWIDCLERQWLSCTDRILPELDTFVAAPGWYRIPLAMRALHDHETGTLAVQGDLMAASGDPRGLIFALAAANLQGDPARADRVRARIDAAGTSAAALLRQVGRIYPDPELADRLASLLGGEGIEGGR